LYLILLAQLATFGTPAGVTRQRSPRCTMAAPLCMTLMLALVLALVLVLVLVLREVLG
jgi:hypothetical protein